tara:strand:+ start:27162 stop:27605 length:444 start_codon:yes stop_codon:yes gene_type:complete
MNLSFRKYNFNIHKQDDKLFIFDEVRKKNVIITPEEWVRQNLLHYFYEDLAYPRSKIAIEKEFILNGRKKRFDMLVFDRDMNPFLLLECKSQAESLNENVLRQCLNYNMNFKVPYLCISNGGFTFLWSLKNGKAEVLDTFPLYPKKD